MSEADDHRISRRSLLRGQLLRWAGTVADEVLPGEPVAPIAAPMPAAGVVDERATGLVREVWEREGHEPLLRALEPVAERVVGRAPISPGMQVLDVGGGDGNVALTAWRRGASVTACDLSPAMVERGRARCPQATWTIADVQNLPFADGVFDVVLSAFGAALAPNAPLALSELVRVTCPGGFVVLAAWLPDGLPETLGSWAELFAPAIEGTDDPADWGRAALMRARLEGLLDELEVSTVTIPLRGPDADAAEVDARYLLLRGRRPIPPFNPT